MSNRRGMQTQPVPNPQPRMPYNMQNPYSGNQAPPVVPQVVPQVSGAPPPGSNPHSMPFQYPQQAGGNPRYNARFSTPVSVPGVVQQGQGQRMQQPGSQPVSVAQGHMGSMHQQRFFNHPAYTQNQPVYTIIQNANGFTVMPQTRPNAPAQQAAGVPHSMGVPNGGTGPYFQQQNPAHQGQQIVYSAPQMFPTPTYAAPFQQPPPSMPQANPVHNQQQGSRPPPTQTPPNFVPHGGMISGQNGGQPQQQQPQQHGVPSQLQQQGMPSLGHHGQQQQPSLHGTPSGPPSLMQAPLSHPQQQQQPPSIIPPAVQSAAPRPQRNRNAIPIINPDTGKNILEEVVSTTKAETSSARSVASETSTKDEKDSSTTTPNPTPTTTTSTGASTNEVRLEMYRKVWEVAGKDTPPAAVSEDSKMHTVKSSEIHSETKTTTTTKEEEKKVELSKAAVTANDKKEVDKGEEVQKWVNENTPTSTTNNDKKKESTTIPEKTSDSSTSATAETIPAAEPELSKKPESAETSPQQEGKKGKVKKNSAARKAEINRKGDEKSSKGDMDLFSDIANNATTSKPPPVPAPAAATAAATAATITTTTKKPEVVATTIAPTAEAAAPVKPVDQSQKAVSVEPANEVKAATPDNSQQSVPAKELPNANNSNPEINSEIDSSNAATDEEDKVPQQQPVQKLKYSYKEDQWSPINVSGKKQYDRDFLMKLQQDPLSQTKPSNLPPMEIIKEKPQDRIKQGFNMMNRVPDFTPNYVKATHSKTGGGITKNRSHGGGNRQDGPPKKVIEIRGLSIQEKVELHSTENAWKPGKLLGVTENGDTDEMSDLRKKARAILNKLTPQKFDVLIDRFNELDIDTEDKLNMCMELIFEKAVDEPGFSVAYAKMCLTLQKKEVKKKEKNADVNFRKLLITRCQKEFERDYLEDVDSEKFKKLIEEADTEEKKKIIKLEWEAEERRARRRSNGNIRFIGELYKLKMLTLRIMHECVSKLLHRRDEESLECLCKLLSTVGKDLEADNMDKIAESNKTIAEALNDAAVNSAQQTIMYINKFPSYFLDMEKIIANKKMSSRVRFLLQDLLDLRKDNWRPRRDVAGPKTIDQIHKEVAQEKTRQQLADLMPVNTGSMNRNSNNNDNRKRSSRGPNNQQGGQGQGGEDGWNTVQRPRGGATQAVSFERNEVNKFTHSVQGMVKKGPVDIESMQFGPGSKSPSFSSWTKGSAGSRLSQTKENQGGGSPAHQQNRFATLGQDGGGQDVYDSRRSASRSVGHPGRSSRGGSTDNERARLLDSVQAAMHSRPSNGPMVNLNNNNRTSMPPPPFNKSVRPPQIRAPVKDQSELLKGAPDLNEDVVKDLAKPLLEEFFHSCDEKEATTCIGEKFHPTTISNFVQTTIEFVLERSPESRNQIGRLFERLVKEGYLKKEQYEKGLCGILDAAEDLVVDIPNMWDYLGEIIEPMLAHGTLPMIMIAETAEAGLKIPGYAGKYAASILHKMSSKQGRLGVGIMWREAGLSWDKFVPASDLSEFIKSNNLSFTESSQNIAHVSPDVSNITDEQLHEKLRVMLQEDKESADIIDWIDSTVGLERTKEHKFIRVLTDAIVGNSVKGPSGSQCEFKESILTKHLGLLKKYVVIGEINMEKQILYALQALMHKLEHPNKILHQIFDVIYDNDIVTDEAFFAWEECEDPAEQEGKGVAIKSTTQFFTWLKETEVDEEPEARN